VCRYKRQEEKPYLLTLARLRHREERSKVGIVKDEDAESPGPAGLEKTKI
jgi:hypothetical protein